MQCAACSVRCAAWNMQCEVCSVQHAVCIVKCAACLLQHAVCSVKCAACLLQCSVRSVQRAMKRKGGHRLCSFVSGWPLLKGGAVNGAWGYMGACLVYTSQPPFLPYIEFICASLRILLRALCVVHEDDFVAGYCLFLYERHPLSLWCSLAYTWKILSILFLYERQPFSLCWI